jgi:hypothetical protein
MSKHFGKSVFVSVLILMLAPIVVAQGSGMNALSTGKVSLNTASLDRSAALMDGDVIETANDGIVAIVGGGTSVLMQGNSIVQYSRSGLNLASGSVSVKTSDGVSTHIGSISIQPVNGSARYRVLQNSNGVQVDVLEGNITVSDSGKNVNVNAGRTVTMACGNCGAMMTQVLQARDQNKQRFQHQQFTENNAVATHVVNAIQIDPGTATVTKK